MTKMIVTDLDGTLLNEERKVSELTKEYLTRLHNEEFVIVAATGRIFSRALLALESTEFLNYVICDTGASIFKPNKEEIYMNYIDPVYISKFLELYDEYDCNYIDICDSDIIYSYTDIDPQIPYLIVTKDKEYILNKCNRPTHISISLKETVDFDFVYNRLVKEYPDLEVMLMQDSFSDRRWIEIIAKDCSKHNAILYLASLLNIKEEDIITFGDGLNDIDMLKSSKNSVAMANALEPVKKVSKDITKYDNNHDGVINYLKEYLKID